MRSERNKSKNSYYEQYKAAHYIHTQANDEFKEELGDKLMEFAYNSDGSDNFVCFVHMLGIHWSTFVKWVKSNEKLAQDYEQAKLIIASKRIKGGLQRKFEPSLVKFTIGFFDPEYKDARDEENQKVKIVVLDNYGDSKSDVSK
jgi:hypothetical protein